MSTLMLRLKQVVLFLLSPLFALGYMALMPVVGLAKLLQGKDPRLDEEARH
ncbi:MAG: hypothetical protein IPK27_19735 [Rhodanobacteraceae bacterium]|nr:hypothetical protein [Rhodanobacteraceae bacterium]